MEWLARIIENNLDEATALHLQRAVVTWVNSSTQGRRGIDGRIERGRELKLPACLGLQDSPTKARIALRNHYLRQASGLISTNLCGPYKRAKNLRIEIDRFTGRLWPCWAGNDSAPGNASDLARLLFMAMRMGGGKLPTTVRQLENILGD